MSYSTIDRADVPAGSFRYGQLASVDRFDVDDDVWAVCTTAAKPKNESDNGASGFDTVLVAHFLVRDEDEARDTAATLARNARHGSVTLVRPEALT